MNVRGSIALALLGVWAVVRSQTAGAQSAHDPVVVRGEHLARTVCSACHVVASDQEFAPLLINPAPSFADIAQRPGTRVATLERFILSTHWDMQSIPMRMPNPMLDKNDARAVAAYILTLKSK